MPVVCAQHVISACLPIVVYAYASSAYEPEIVWLLTQFGARRNNPRTGVVHKWSVANGRVRCSDDGIARVLEVGAVLCAGGVAVNACDVLGTALWQSPWKFDCALPARAAPFRVAHGRSDLAVSINAQILRVPALNVVTTGRTAPDVCAICLYECVTNDPWVRLPCVHGAQFHAPCIARALASHARCPLCRTSIFDSKVGVHAGVDKLPAQINSRT